jgi:predicted negative regulator of RcsB-dependent stress response
MKKNYKNVVAGIMLLAGAYFVYRYFKSAPKKS